MGIVFKVKGIPEQMLWAVAAGRNHTGAAGSVTELLPSCPNTISSPWGAGAVLTLPSLTPGGACPMARNHLACQPVSSIPWWQWGRGWLSMEGCLGQGQGGRDTCVGWMHTCWKVFLYCTALPMNSSLKAVSEATQLQTCFAVPDN